MLPVFLWLLFAPGQTGPRPPLSSPSSATTDFVDGYIARHFDQVSDLGKVLDPVADRLLFFVGVGGILVDGSVPTWFAVAVLVREVLVAGADARARRRSAPGASTCTWFGKAGTFGLMIAFPLFLAAESTVGWADPAETLAWLAGIPGLVLCWYSAAPLRADGPPGTGRGPGR